MYKPDKTGLAEEEAAEAEAAEEEDESESTAAGPDQLAMTFLHKPDQTGLAEEEAAEAAEAAEAEKAAKEAVLMSSSDEEDSINSPEVILMPNLIVSNKDIL